MRFFPLLLMLLMVIMMLQLQQCSAGTLVSVACGKLKPLHSSLKLPFFSTTSPISSSTPSTTRSFSTTLTPSPIPSSTFSQYADAIIARLAIPWPPPSNWSSALWAIYSNNSVPSSKFIHKVELFYLALILDLIFATYEHYPIVSIIHISPSHFLCL